MHSQIDFRTKRREFEGGAILGRRRLFHFPVVACFGAQVHHNQRFRLICRVVKYTQTRADADHVIPAKAGISWVGLLLGCARMQAASFPRRRESPGQDWRRVAVGMTDGDFRRGKKPAATHRTEP